MFSRRKILIVEDNALNRGLLHQILENDYDVLEAENGREALDILFQYREGISLVLLDIVMPVMDGYTFLSEMKAEPSIASIPVIVTTQNDGESDEVAALSHGATDFVAKPYKPQIILHRVANIINLRETAAVINEMQYDRLTGVYSREYFYQQVKDVLMRNPDKKYDIICSDIENFKLINDVFGVSTGDRLLRGMADICKQKIEGKGICGRINSDQFACLLNRGWVYTDDIFVEANAQVNEILDVRNISIKWGIYCIDDNTISVEQMCDRALLSAKSIKGQYGKYFAEYDDKLRNQMLKDQAIADSMETALAQEQFQIYLQPKYRINDESLVGAEALVRWKHPEWGFQSPAEFIPLFEKNGFITKLDQFIWDKACAALREWDDKGYEPIAISVNVSRADIYNADIAKILTHTLKKYNLTTSRLHLEITESAYTENPKQIIDTVSQLRKLGFIIEMDDFGSGYSSLNMLNEMPIDILKLDMKFIQSETAKPASQGILKFIINLARWMNLSVVAEGVETREQLERLDEIGCDYVQGYYFARPMPCSDFEMLLREYRAQEMERVEGEPLPYLKEMPVLFVADESAKYREEVKRYFQGQYQVIGFGTGKETLDYLKRYKNEKISVLVLSLTLPETDGFEVLRMIQREKALWGLPVIITSPPDAEIERKVLEMGADDFMSKPHFMESLAKRVWHVMNMFAFQEKNRILRNIAYKDHLTGVLNRRGLDEAVKTLGKNDFPLVVYTFDVDNLKLYNDSCGHAKGDQMLAQMGTILRTHMRDEDILARIGGDEFVAIIKQIASEEIVLEKGKEICEAVWKYSEKENIPVSCSAGVAIMQNGDLFYDVMERADKALYQAKNIEKGNCSLWKGETR